MSKESLNDYNLYKNVYLVCSEEEDKVGSPAIPDLLNYYKGFLDSYHDRVDDETEYLSDDVQYRKFRENFLVAFKTYNEMSNSKFAIPLFIYLYDSNPLGYNDNKFEKFVEESEKLNFSDLLSMYDAYDMDMDIEEKQALK